MTVSNLLNVGNLKEYELLNVGNLKEYELQNAVCMCMSEKYWVVIGTYIWENIAYESSDNIKLVPRLWVITVFISVSNRRGKL